MAENMYSSAMTLVDYDENTKALTIRFRDGSEYTYEEVPYDVYDGLLSANSAGGYFNANIRGAYSFR